MSKIYSAVKLPESAVNIIKEKNIELDMHDELTTPSNEDMIKRVADADGLITGVNVHAPAEVINSSDNLKVIANVGSGFNNIDVDIANEKNIAVTNTPVYESVASTA